MLEHRTGGFERNRHFQILGRCRGGISEKKKQEWLSDLAAQVDQRQRQKEQQRLEQEMAAMPESIAEQKMRENADAQLRAELAMRSGSKAGPK